MITLKEHHPNPQGKGLTPLVDSLTDFTRQLCPMPKPVQQIAAELFTALFVLESQIRFKPVLEKSYWLYQKQGVYHLSLIAPEEWSEQRSGLLVGECRLLHDLTWSLALADSALANTALMQAIDTRRKQFEQQLSSAAELHDTLPVYVGSLSFYSRVLGSALAYSLGASMQQSGIYRLSHAEALQQSLLAAPAAD